MKQWKAYLWKEWHQNHMMAWAGLALFLLIAYLPMLDSLRYGSYQLKYDPDSVEGTILWGGPLLAILLGVLAMGREQGTLTTFWRSRPVCLKTWLLTKYLTGLAILGLVCGVTLGLNVFIIVVFNARGQTHLQASLALLTAYSFILMLVYSTSFMLGILIRKIVNAFLLSLGALALILVIPLVMTPLNGFSIEILTPIQYGALELRHYLNFLLGMTLSSIAMLGLSGTLLKRNLQIDCDQRTLWFSWVLLLLILGASVAFPIGTNLSPEKIIPLPIQQHGSAGSQVVIDPNETWILTSDGPEEGSARDRQFRLVRIDLSSGQEQQSIKIADSSELEKGFYSIKSLIISPPSASLAYFLLEHTRRNNAGTDYEYPVWLCTVSLESDIEKPLIHRIALQQYTRNIDRTIQATLFQDHLYVYGDGTLLTFALNPPSGSPGSSRSSEPTLIQNQNIGAIGLSYAKDRFNAPEQVRIALVPIPNTTLQERLALTSKLDIGFAGKWCPADSNQILVADGRSMILAVFKLDRTQDNTANFRLLGQLHKSSLERLVPLLVFPDRLLYHDQRAFCIQRAGGMTAYNVADPNHVHRLGHYAAGERFSMITVLDDTRILVGGSRLHVLNVPPKTDY